MEFRILFAVDKSRKIYISYLVKELEKKGIVCKIIDDLDLYESSISNRKILRWMQKPKKIETIFSEFRPDLIFTERVSHFSSLSLKFKIPLVIFLRGNYWEEVSESKKNINKSMNKRIEVWTKEKIAERSFKESALILPICKYLEKIVKDRYPDKRTDVLYQGIDNSEWFEQKGMNLQHPCIGIVQDANIWKKTKELTILPKILEKFPNVHFYWAGDGPFKNKILDELGKFENFHWLGRLEYPNKIREFLSEMDIYALFTGSDMSPHTILEAGLMKKPILATDVGGVSESLQKNMGFLINENDVDGWVEKISILINDKEKILEMGENSYQFITNEFNWEKISNDFLEIIKKSNIIKQ